VIKFRCKNCDQKISVPETQAGKKGKCPKCKSIVVVPKIKAADSLKDQINPPDEKQQNVSSPVPELQLEKGPPGQTGKTHKAFANGFKAMQYHEQLIKMEKMEKPPVRKLPWILDIFLYPTSMSGLINLGIFWMLPILLGLIARLMPIRLIWGIVGFIIGGYMFYYFIECIRDSALGGIRAPENIGNLPDMGDAVSQFMEIIASAVLFWGPVSFYFIFTRKTDTIYWLLLGYGIFFFPMGLLALAMFRSSAAFNPFVWIMSIFSTFFQYCGLVLFFCVLGWLVSRIMSSFRGALLFAFIFNAVFVYLAMVGAHLLGRFYYLNSKKLNWEV
jgi:phage FluMu protein Com